MDAPIVTGAELATALGVEEPTEAQIAVLERHISDAEAAILNYLNRDSLVPFEVLRSGVWMDARYPPEHWRAWPWVIDEYDDQFTVSSYTARGDGYYDVVLSIGFDGPNTPGVLSFIHAHVREQCKDEPLFPKIKAAVRSVSAEGQSISYDTGSVAKGAAGAETSLESLARHRRYSAHRAPSRTSI